MTDPNSIHPAIVYEPDGYRLDGQKLMGRQAAGLGFLRAAVVAANGATLQGHTVRKSSAESFARTIAEIDPKAKSAWLPPTRPDLLKQVGHLYVPGPGLGEFARQRLRSGVHAWSITGVTHTTASHGAMDSIAELPLAPVMPWDAVICTSQAVKRTVATALEAQREYLTWRLGKPSAWTLPQLPVIPLGVHCRDFECDAPARKTARATLQIADDEVVFLFVGRLSFHAKAHPHAMYAGLQAAAQASGRKLVLVQCGWFANEHIEKAFHEGATQTCPGVRCIYTDGRAAEARTASWAAADVFISLSDNIQETFGLTPIEAMAAGLPVVVTDWDGYKDTVRDGVDGFRIRTWSPAPGAGERLSWLHETEVDTYDMYCGLACQFVALDHAMLAQRLTELATDEALRRRLGDAARQHAGGSFDWAVVYRAYQQLWSALDGLRPKEWRPAPRMSPSRLDPFLAFAHYPTQLVDAHTIVRHRDGAHADDYAKLLATPLFSYASRELPPAATFLKLWSESEKEGANVGRLADGAGIALPDAMRFVVAVAKMGLFELAAASA